MLRKINRGIAFLLSVLMVMTSVDMSSLTLHAQERSGSGIVNYSDAGEDDENVSESGDEEDAGEDAGSSDGDISGNDDDDDDDVDDADDETDDEPDISGNDYGNDKNDDGKGKVTFTNKTLKDDQQNFLFGGSFEYWFDDGERSPLVNSAENPSVTTEIPEGANKLYIKFMPDNGNTIATTDGFHAYVLMKVNGGEGATIDYDNFRYYAYDYNFGELDISETSFELEYAFNEPKASLSVSSGMTSTENIYDIAKDDGYTYFKDTNGEYIKWNYNKSWEHAQVSINSDDVEDKLDKGLADLSETWFHKLPYIGNDDGTVDLTIYMDWNYRPTDVITVNGREYYMEGSDASKQNPSAPTFMNFDNEVEWFKAYSFNEDDRRVRFVLEDIPTTYLENGKELSYYDSENELEINMELDVRPIERTECVISNFVWSTDDEYDDEAAVIANADVTILEVNYPDYISENKDLYEVSSTSFTGDPVVGLKGVDRKDKGNAKFISFDGDGKDFADMTLPEGSEVTMEIHPHPGYQITSFGIDDNNVEPGDEDHPCQFTFTVGRSDFRLGAAVEEIGNTVDTSRTGLVTEGSVELSGTDQDKIVHGTAVLSVLGIPTEADNVPGAPDAITDEQVVKFTEAADEYNIQGYLGFHLDNVINQGIYSKEDEDGNSEMLKWSSRMSIDDTEGAMLTLKLADPASKVRVIRDNYGTISVVQDVYYNREKNEITFKIDGNSVDDNQYYAIATVADIKSFNLKASTATIYLSPEDAAYPVDWVQWHEDWAPEGVDEGHGDYNSFILGYEALSNPQDPNSRIYIDNIFWETSNQSVVDVFPYWEDGLMKGATVHALKTTGSAPVTITATVLGSNAKGETVEFKKTCKVTVVQGTINVIMDRPERDENGNELDKDGNIITYDENWEPSAEPNMVPTIVHSFSTLAQAKTWIETYWENEGNREYDNWAIDHNPDEDEFWFNPSRVTIKLFANQTLAARGTGVLNFDGPHAPGEEAPVFDNNVTFDLNGYTLTANDVINIRSNTDYYGGTILANKGLNILEGSQAVITSNVTVATTFTMERFTGLITSGTFTVKGLTTLYGTSRITNNAAMTLAGVKLLTPGTPDDYPQGNENPFDDQGFCHVNITRFAGTEANGEEPAIPAGTIAINGAITGDGSTKLDVGLAGEYVTGLETDINTVLVDINEEVLLFSTNQSTLYSLVTVWLPPYSQTGYFVAFLDASRRGVFAGKPDFHLGYNYIESGEGETAVWSHVDIGNYASWNDACNAVAAINDTDEEHEYELIINRDEVLALNVFKTPKVCYGGFTIRSGVDSDIQAVDGNGNPMVDEQGNPVMKPKPVRIYHTLTAIGLTCGTKFEDIAFVKVKADATVTTGFLKGYSAVDPYTAVTLNLAGWDFTAGGELTFNTPLNINDAKKTGAFRLDYGTHMITRNIGQGEYDENYAVAHSVPYDPNDGNENFPYTFDADKQTYALIIGSITNVGTVELGDGQWLVVSDYVSSVTYDKTGNLTKCTYTEPVFSPVSVYNNGTIWVCSADARQDARHSDNNIVKDAAAKAKGTAKATISNMTLHNRGDFSADNLTISELILYDEARVESEVNFTISGILYSSTDRGLLLTARNPKTGLPYLTVNGSVELADDDFKIQVGTIDSDFRHYEDDEYMALHPTYYVPLTGNEENASVLLITKNGTIDCFVPYFQTYEDVNQNIVRDTNLPLSCYADLNEDGSFKAYKQFERFDDYGRSEGFFDYDHISQCEFGAGNRDGYFLKKSGNNIYVLTGEKVAVAVATFVGDDYYVNNTYSNCLDMAQSRIVGFYTSWAEAVAAVNAIKTKQNYEFILLRDIGEGTVTVDEMGYESVTVASPIALSFPQTGCIQSLVVTSLGVPIEGTEDENGKPDYRSNLICYTSMTALSSNTIFCNVDLIPCKKVGNGYSTSPVPINAAAFDLTIYEMNSEIEVVNGTAKEPAWLGSVTGNGKSVLTITLINKGMFKIDGSINKFSKVNADCCLVLTGSISVDALSVQSGWIKGKITVKNLWLLEKNNDLVAYSDVSVTENLYLSDDSGLNTSLNNGAPVKINNVYTEGHSRVSFARKSSKSGYGTPPVTITGDIHGLLRLREYGDNGRARQLSPQIQKNGAVFVDTGADYQIASIGNNDTSKVEYDRWESSEGIGIITGSASNAKGYTLVKTNKTLYFAKADDSEDSLRSSIVILSKYGGAYAGQLLDYNSAVTEINNLNAPDNDYSILLACYVTDSESDKVTITDTVLTDKNPVGTFALPAVNKAPWVGISSEAKKGGERIPVVVTMTGKITGYGVVRFRDVQLNVAKSATDATHAGNTDISISKNTATGITGQSELIINNSKLYAPDPVTGSRKLPFICGGTAGKITVDSFELTRASLKVSAAGSVVKTLKLDHSDFEANAQFTVTDIQTYSSHNAGSETFVTVTQNAKGLPQFTLTGDVTSGELYVKVKDAKGNELAYIKEGDTVTDQLSGKPLILAPNANAQKVHAYGLASYNDWNGVEGTVSYKNSANYIVNDNTNYLLVKVTDGEDGILGYARTWNDAVAMINNANSATTDYTISFLKEGIWRPDAVVSNAAKDADHAKATVGSYELNPESQAQVPEDGSKAMFGTAKIAAVTMPKATAARTITIESEGEFASILLVPADFAPLNDVVIKNAGISTALLYNKLYLPYAASLSVAKGKTVTFESNSDNLMFSKLTGTAGTVIFDGQGYVNPDPQGIDNIKQVVVVNSDVNVANLELVNARMTFNFNKNCNCVVSGNLTLKEGACISTQNATANTFTYKLGNVILDDTDATLEYNRNKSKTAFGTTPVTITGTVNSQGGKIVLKEVGVDASRLAKVLTGAEQANGAVFVDTGVDYQIASIGNNPTSVFSYVQMEHSAENGYTQWDPITDDGINQFGYTLVKSNKALYYTKENRLVFGLVALAVDGQSDRYQMLDYGSAIAEITNHNSPADSYTVSLAPYVTNVADKSAGLDDTILTDKNPAGAFALPAANKAAKITIKSAAKKTVNAQKYTVPVVVRMTGNISGFGQVEFNDVILYVTKSVTDVVNTGVATVTMGKNNSKDSAERPTLTISNAAPDLSTGSEQKLPFIASGNLAAGKLIADILILSNASVGVTTAGSAVTELSLTHSDLEAKAQFTVTNLITDGSRDEGRESFITVTQNAKLQPQFTVNGTITARENELYVKVNDSKGNELTYSENNEGIKDQLTGVPLILAPKADAEKVKAYGLAGAYSWNGVDGVISYTNTSKYIVNENVDNMLIRIEEVEGDETKLFSYAKTWNDAVTMINNANKAGTVYNIVFIKGGVWRPDAVVSVSAKDSEHAKATVGSYDEETYGTAAIAKLTFPKATAAGKIIVKHEDGIDVDLIYSGDLAPTADFEIHYMKFSSVAAVKETNPETKKIVTLYKPSGETAVTAASGKRISIVRSYTTVNSDEQKLVLTKLSGNAGVIYIESISGYPEVLGDVNLLGFELWLSGSAGLNVHGKINVKELKMYQDAKIVCNGDATITNLDIFDAGQFLMNPYINGKPSASKLTIGNLDTHNSSGNMIQGAMGAFKIGNIDKSPDGPLDLHYCFTAPTAKAPGATTLEITGTISGEGEVALRAHLPKFDGHQYVYDVNNSGELTSPSSIEEIDKLLNVDSEVESGKLVVGSTATWKTYTKIDEITTENAGWFNRMLVKAGKCGTGKIAPYYIGYSNIGGNIYYSKQGNPIEVRGFSTKADLKNRGNVTYEAWFRSLPDAVAEINRIASNKDGNDNSYILLELFNDLGSADKPEAAITLPTACYELDISGYGNTIYTTGTSLALKTTTEFDNLAIVPLKKNKTGYEVTQYSIAGGKNSLILGEFVTSDDGDNPYIKDVTCGPLKQILGTELYTTGNVTCGDIIFDGDDIRIYAGGNITAANIDFGHGYNCYIEGKEIKASGTVKGNATLLGYGNITVRDFDLPINAWVSSEKAINVTGTAVISQNAEIISTGAFTATNLTLSGEVRASDITVKNTAQLNGAQLYAGTAYVGDALKTKTGQAKDGKVTLNNVIIKSADNVVSVKKSPKGESQFTVTGTVTADENFDVVADTNADNAFIDVTVRENTEGGTDRGLTIISVPTVGMLLVTAKNASDGWFRVSVDMMDQLDYEADENGYEYDLYHNGIVYKKGTAVRFGLLDDPVKLLTYSSVLSSDDKGNILDANGDGLKNGDDTVSAPVLVSVSTFETIDEALSEINTLGRFKTLSGTGKNSKFYDDYAVVLPDIPNFDNENYGMICLVNPKTGKTNALALPVKVGELTLRSGNNDQCKVMFTGGVTLKSNLTLDKVLLENQQDNTVWALGTYRLTMRSDWDEGTYCPDIKSMTGGAGSELVLDAEKGATIEFCPWGNVNVANLTLVANTGNNPNPSEIRCYFGDGILTCTNLTEKTDGYRSGIVFSLSSSKPMVVNGKVSVEGFERNFVNITDPDSMYPGMPIIKGKMTGDEFNLDPDNWYISAGGGLYYATRVDSSALVVGEHAQFA